MPDRHVPDDWEDFVSELGQRVAKRREELRLTQEELAHRTGLSRNQIQNIEKNRNNNHHPTNRRHGTANPRLDTMWALASALEVELDYLISRAHGERPPGPEKTADQSDP